MKERNIGQLVKFPFGELSVIVEQDIRSWTILNCLYKTIFIQNVTLFVIIRSACGSTEI